MPPPFGLTMKIFYRQLYMKRCIFLPFCSKKWKIQQCLMVFCVFKFQKNGRICGFHWTFRSKKCFSFRGALPLWPPNQGLCLWTPLGASPPDPCYRLALRALAMAPLCQILNTPLVISTVSTSCRVGNSIWFTFLVIFTTRKLVTFDSMTIILTSWPWLLQWQLQQTHWSVWSLFHSKSWFETFRRCLMFNQTADYLYISDI